VFQRPTATATSSLRTRLVEDPDAEIRAEAAAAWLAWEDAVVSQERHGTPKAYSSRPPAAQLAFVRICAHYFSHSAWLEEGALLRDAHRLAGIPGVLIHGRLDLCSPLGAAWELAGAWPDARLVVVDDSGHTGSKTMTKEILGAIERFSQR
jgi:proline iminopeptidase